MKRAGQPSRTIPSNPSGRVSFECDRRPNFHAAVPIRKPKPIALSITGNSLQAANRVSSSETASLSSSAPSAFWTYAPFSAFWDDGDADDEGRGRTGATRPRRDNDGGRGNSKGDGDGTKALKDDVMMAAVVQGQTELVSVQGQKNILTSSMGMNGASGSRVGIVPCMRATKEMMTATTDAAGAGTGAGAVVAAGVEQQHTRPVSLPAESTTTTIATAKSGSSQGQRRHSSEDGLVHGHGHEHGVGQNEDGTRCLPLSMYISNGPQPPSENVYAIPTKCRMVFHMRDEISRPHRGPGAGAAGADKTRRGSVPQQQQQRQSRQFRQTPEFPLKKSQSAKCTKTVSFKELDQWKDPSTARTAVDEDIEGKVGTKVGGEPPSAKISTRATMMRSGGEAGGVSVPMLIRPSIEGDLGTSGRSTSMPVSRVPPSSLPARPAQPRPSAQTHHRNLSTPSPSTPPSSSSSSSQTPATAGMVPRTMSTGAERSFRTKSTDLVSGGKFSRLWRSVAHRVSSHGHQHDGGQATIGGRGGGGDGAVASDLEPLVAIVS
ncbi:hypothetical protein BC939DRAFT_434319, partial [Gamsiella multidivaricata]|uniref:uncharacterized protein n=1 Tax=Gamsiella multidivaricata TaxID=101098 RepID=UPI00221FEBA5